MQTRMFEDNEQKSKKKKYDFQYILNNQEIEIIGSNIKITTYKNAKILLNRYLKHASYRECIFDLYTNDVFRAIPLQIRRRILYEYFYDAEESIYCSYLDKIKNKNARNFFQFTSMMKEYNFYESIEDKLDFYEFYMKKNNKDYMKFRNLYFKKNFNVETSFEIIQNEKEFDIFERNLLIEYFYIILKEFEKKIEHENIKNIAIRFLFLIQDLYEDGFIYYKMNYHNFVSLVQRNPIYNRLMNSIYSPQEIYSYYMFFLEKKLQNYEEDPDSPAISSIDRRAIKMYKDLYEDEREEGEI